MEPISGWLLLYLSCQLNLIFRVGFYGQRFGDLDGEEFVYKEPMLTKLPEIKCRCKIDSCSVEDEKNSRKIYSNAVPIFRLESFYSNKYGAENLIIITDSKQVNSGLIDTSSI